MRRDESGILKPFDFRSVEQEFPSIRCLNVDLDVFTMTPIDSSNVTPDRWREIAYAIRDNYADYDGFVVLHGTDTMSYTSSALSFMLEGLQKPVIFTGSQIPMGILRTDGRENLITAIEIAAAKENGKPLVPEVCLYFQNKLMRANRSSKLSAEALSAFDSVNYPPLAEVGVNIVYNRQNIMYPEGWFDPGFVMSDSLEVRPQMETNVVILKIFPGLSLQTLNAVLSVDGLKGVILETYGTGNAPTAPWFIDVLESAIRRGIIIMNITQCHGGYVAMHLYETGLSLERIGVVCGYDMTCEAAITKMMWLLGQGYTPEKCKNALSEPFRGEFTK